MRKVIIAFLVGVLFLSLIGGAQAITANIAFSKPDKVETWLKDSGFYDAFVAYSVDQAQKSLHGDTQTTTGSLNDSVIQQAAKSTFTPAFLEKNVKTVIDANYAWLEGKTDKPAFTVDLTNAKQTFADQLAGFTQTYLAKLPACTPEQLAQMGNVQSIDPLSVSCRPATLTPEAGAAQVKQNILTNGEFLNDPVVTQANIDQGNKQSQPYYSTFSFAPTAYKVAVKLPWVFGVIALLSALGIFFIASRRTKGLRLISFALAGAGILLLLERLATGSLTRRIDHMAFNSNTVGQLQHAMTTFVHNLVNQLVSLNLWIGVGYLLLGIALFVVAQIFAGKTTRTAPAPIQPASATAPASSEPSETRPTYATNKQPAPQPPQPPKRKRPRLIQ
jgi:hypothetical protein